MTKKRIFVGLLLMMIFILPNKVKALTGAVGIECDTGKVDSDGIVTCSLTGSSDELVSAVLIPFTVTNATVESFTATELWETKETTDGKIELTALNTEGAEAIDEFEIGTLTLKVIDNSEAETDTSETVTDNVEETGTDETTNDGTEDGTAQTIESIEISLDGIVFYDDSGVENSITAVNESVSLIDDGFATVLDSTVTTVGKTDKETKKDYTVAKIIFIVIIVVLVLLNVWRIVNNILKNKKQ